MKGAGVDAGATEVAEGAAPNTNGAAGAGLSELSGAFVSAGFEAAPKVNGAAPAALVKAPPVKLFADEAEPND